MATPNWLKPSSEYTPPEWSLAWEVHKLVASIFCGLRYRVVDFHDLDKWEALLDPEAATVRLKMWKPNSAPVILTVRLTPPEIERVQRLVEEANSLP